MATLINGVRGDHLSVADRGLLYGQSVFETVAVSNGKPHLLDLHIQRLTRGCATLEIPVDQSLIAREVIELSEGIDVGLIRVTVTMGVGERGYKNPTTPSPSRIVSVHTYPKIPPSHYAEGVELGVADLRLSHQPLLAGVKHSNRLEQVIARSQWQPNWQESLLLDQDDNVIEATQSNVFIVRGNRLSTPLLDRAGVAGVMREFVLLNADKIAVRAATVSLSVADMVAADAIFLTNSVIGLWPVRLFQGRQFGDHRLAHKLLNLMREDGAIPRL